MCEYNNPVNQLPVNAKGQTEAEFLAAYQPGNWPHPSVTVDLLIFSLEEGTPDLLMIRRKNHPWIYQRALPGGFVDQGEYTIQAAARELQEECSLENIPLSELSLFSGPHRDPRCWTMSHAFVAVVNRSQVMVKAGDDAAAADWFRLSWSMGEGKVSFSLVSGDEILSATVDYTMEEGAFGSEYRLGDYSAQNIACDHSKMIAAALLRLYQAGKLSPQ